MPAQWDPSSSRTFSNAYWGFPVSRSAEDNGYATIQISSSSSSPPFTPYGDNYIEHRVSKMDTLAGVAIKYGVEIADVKRMNGLVTDIQMFAHKSLQIPLPGRHPPPSPVIPNVSVLNMNRESSKTPPGQSTNDIFHSFQSLKLKPSLKKAISPESTEMSVYKSSRKSLHFNDRISQKSAASDPPYGQHRKSQSLLNFISLEKDGISIDITESDTSIRRRPKTDPEPFRHAPEILLKEESNGGRGNGLALRPKLGSRGDGESCGQNFVCGGDSLFADVRVSVRKSPSTANLNEIDSGSSIWQTSKWSLKADIVARPVIDGLPKPVAGRRNYKAAID
ncbi:F-box protein [Platanthera zijinensis]|uniref:F-box protein n=1 Tax=Platanthera zijinensis TaxID=2320716 RepID=A0AAP0G3B0_9ASPA